MTCATPGMLSSRGRIVKSAASRNSIGVARSLVTATIMICPMIEQIGPIIGVTFGGQLLAHQVEPFGDQLAVAIDVGGVQSNST